MVRKKVIKAGRNYPPQSILITLILLENYFSMKNRKHMHRISIEVERSKLINVAKYKGSIIFGSLY